MESAFDSFSRHAERLQKLPLRPTEYVGWVTDDMVDLMGPIMAVL